jgi:hypothetical protein
MVEHARLEGVDFGIRRLKIIVFCYFVPEMQNNNVALSSVFIASPHVFEQEAILLEKTVTQLDYSRCHISVDRRLVFGQKRFHFCGGAIWNFVRLDIKTQLTILFRQ